MGSGRTPLLRTIFGLDRPERETIRVNKKALSAGRSTPAMRLIEGVGYLSEDRKGEGLTLNQSMADNVTVTKFDSVRVSAGSISVHSANRPRNWLTH